MKNLKLIALSLLLGVVVLSAHAQKRLFDAFPDDKEITSIYISKAAMKMGFALIGGGEKGESKGKINGIAECIRNPEGMEVVTAETEKAAAKVSAYASEIIEKLGLEPLVSINEDNEKFNIFTGRVTDDTVMEDVLIEMSESNEHTIVYIKGEIDVKALSEMNSEP